MQLCKAGVAVILVAIHGGIFAQTVMPETGVYLHLEQAISLALERNHDMKLSSLAVRSSEASTVIAHAAPNPSLTIQSTGLNPHTGIGSGNLRDKRADTTIQIQHLIERGDKRELRTRNAMNLERASRDDLRETERQLRVIVSQAYYDLLAAQNRVTIAKDTSELFDGTLAAARKRGQAGDIAGADIERLRVDVLRAHNDFRQAQNDLSDARLALALLLNDESDAERLHAADSWPTSIQPAEVAEIDSIVHARPDVRAAQARVDAAMAAQKLALASRTRDVTVGMQFEHVPASENNNTYGISVQIPLFSRYDFHGEILSAETALDSAREALAKATDAARNEIRRALHAAQSAAERNTRFREELLPAARASADAAEYGFKSGALGVMDVLDARRTYRNTELEALAAQTDYAKALAAWRAAIMEEAPK